MPVLGKYIKEYSYWKYQAKPQTLFASCVVIELR